VPQDVVGQSLDVTDRGRSTCCILGRSTLDVTGRGEVNLLHSWQIYT
jgi:hypothetical protein